MGERPSALTQFFGAALIGLGGLIALLSGGCTGYVLLGNLSATGYRLDISSLIFILGFGAPFIAVGIWLMFEGRRLLRQVPPSR